MIVFLLQNNNYWLITIKQTNKYKFVVFQAIIASELNVVSLMASWGHIHSVIHFNAIFISPDRTSLHWDDHVPNKLPAVATAIAGWALLVCVRLFTAHGATPCRKNVGRGVEGWKVERQVSQVTERDYASRLVRQSLAGPIDPSLIKESSAMSGTRDVNTLCFAALLSSAEGTDTY